MLIPKKYHFHLIALIAVSVIFIYPRLAQRVDPAVVTAGTTAAEHFLKLIDEKHYEQGWQEASALIQKKIVLEVWNHQIPAMRKQVGPLIKRVQGKATLSDWAQDAPDGQYLTLKYDSSFAQQKEALETIILTLEEDGSWRVAGYFIK